MKKIKQFYAEHKTEVIAFSSGVAAASLVGLYYVHKTKNGMQLVNANLYHDTRDDTDFLFVSHANGTHRSYLWNVTPKPE